MMANRGRMRGQRGLGEAIDARRQREQAQLEQQGTLGTAGNAPLASGGSPAGGGGVTGDPALPESFVTGLAGGSGNPPQNGELTITGSGSALVTQDSVAGEIDVHSPAYTAGDGLELSAEEFAVDGSVVRTSGDQSVAGLKSFSSLPQSAATPTAATDLTTKDYVDERTKVVHRQVFPAAGSRDSVGGNNEINLPWGVSAYPSGATLPTITLVCESDISFNVNDIGILESNYVKVSWTSTEVSGTIVKGAQIAICASFPVVGSNCNISALIQINNVARINSVFLSINDEAGSISPESPTNLVSNLVDNEWITIETTNVSLQNLSNVGGIVLTINGTADSMNVGSTELFVREIQVVQLE